MPPAGEFPQHRSARRFHHPSPLFRWCQERGLLYKPGNALVLGAGLSVEVMELVQLGWTVDGVETVAGEEQHSDLYERLRWESNVRIVTSIKVLRRRDRASIATHVFEFIPDPRRRTALLERRSTPGERWPYPY